MAKGHKKAEGLVRPPPEQVEQQKTIPKWEAIPKSFESDLEKIEDPQAAAEYLDAQRGELDLRAESLKVQYRNGLIDAEKYFEIMKDLGGQRERFYKKLEQTEDKFGGLPPAKLETSGIPVEAIDKLKPAEFKAGQEIVFGGKNCRLMGKEEDTGDWMLEAVDGSFFGIASEIKLAQSQLASERTPEEAIRVPQEEEKGPLDAAATFEDLHTKLKELGGEKGEIGDYSVNELIGVITDIRDGAAELNQLTRENGLRAKVAELLEKEKAAKAGAGQDVLEGGASKPLDAGDVELKQAEAGPDVAGEIKIDGNDFEAQKEELKAQATAERVQEIDQKLTELYTRANQIPRDSDHSSEREYVKNEIEELEAEKNKLLGRTWGAKFKNVVGAGYAAAAAGGEYVGEKFVAGAEHIGTKMLSLSEKIKSKLKGFLPRMGERLLTSFTFGWWDVHQAEKFRSATKKFGENLEFLAGSIRQENGLLSMDEAQREADQMVREIGASDRVRRQGGPTAADFEAASIGVSAEKRADNKRKEDQAVAQTLEGLKYKLETSAWFMKYKGTESGQNVMSPENVRQLEDKIRGRFRELRNAQTTKDVVDYKKIIRDELDPKYWNRYVYAGLALALNSIGLSYALTPPGTTEAVSQAAVSGTAEVGTKAAEVALKDTIWAEAKRQLVQQGIDRPTDAMVQEVSTQIAKESGVEVITRGGEVLWQETAGGAAKDIALQKGFMLKLGGALQKIAAIKAGIAA